MAFYFILPDSDFSPRAGGRGQQKEAPKPLLFSQLLQLPGKGPGSVWGKGEVLGFGRTVMAEMSLSLEVGMSRNQLSLGLSPFLQFLNLGQQGSIIPHPVPI